MAAYAINDVKVSDPAKMQEYQKQVPPIIAAYGGEYLVRGGEAEIIEGDWTPNRVVVLKFDSVEKAKAWYHSEEYAPMMKLRLEASKANFIIVEGS